MPRLHHTVTLAALIAAAGTLSVAQPDPLFGPPGGPAGPAALGENPERQRPLSPFRATFDVDNDNVISETEAEALEVPLQQYRDKLLAQFDDDADNLLTRDELEGVLPGPPEDRPRGPRGRDGDRPGPRGAFGPGRGFRGGQAPELAPGDGDERPFGRRARPDAQERRGKIMDQVDTDGDGVISDAEKQAAQAAAAQRRTARALDMLEFVDADADAVITEDEIAEFQLKAEERRAEREALMEERREQFRQNVLDTFDANENGVLDDDEKQAARQAFQAKREELLVIYDDNNNGRLDRAERRAIREDRMNDE